MAFCNKNALEHFAKYTGKNLRWSFSLEKLQAVKKLLLLFTSIEYTTQIIENIARLLLNSATRTLGSE